MLRTLLRSKLDHRFDLYDQDHDGLVGSTDYAIVADRIAAAFGHAPQSPHATAVRTAYEGLWKTLCDATGHPAAKAMGRETFDRAMTLLALGDGTYEQNLVPVTVSVFAAADADGDGALDHAEAVRLVRAFGVPAAVAEDLATALDENADGLVTHEELVTAYHDYLTSDDLDRPGNALFGWTIV